MIHFSTWLILSCGTQQMKRAACIEEVKMKHIFINSEPYPRLHADEAATVPDEAKWLPARTIQYLQSIC